MNKTNVTLLMITVLAVLAMSGCNQKPVEQKAPVTTTPSAQGSNQSATGSITIEESKPKDVTGSITIEESKPKDVTGSLTVEPTKPTTKVEVTPVNSEESLKEANKALEEANKAVSAAKATSETTKKTVTPAE